LKGRKERITRISDSGNKEKKSMLSNGMIMNMNFSYSNVWEWCYCVEWITMVDL
jgi:hypothetical protein